MASALTLVNALIHFSAGETRQTRHEETAEKSQREPAGGDAGDELHVC